MLWSYRWSPLSVAAGVHKSQSLLSKSPKLFRVAAESQWEKRGDTCVGLGHTKLEHSTAVARAHRDSLTALTGGSEETSPPRVESPGQEVGCNLIISLFLWFWVTGGFCVWNKQVIHQRCQSHQAYSSAGEQIRTEMEDILSSWKWL